MLVKGVYYAESLVKRTQISEIRLSQVNGPLKSYFYVVLLKRASYVWTSTEFWMIPTQQPSSVSRGTVTLIDLSGQLFFYP